MAWLLTVKKPEIIIHNLLVYNQANTEDHWLYQHVETKLLLFSCISTLINFEISMNSGVS